MLLTLSTSAVGLPGSATATESPLASAVAPPARGAATSAPAESAPLRSRAAAVDVVEEWGLDSFPASDPPSNW